MKDWFKPDVRWKIVGGVKTRKEYLEHFAIEGRFHKDVPKNIIESYETVEYLMAHAYYHWPMYDEAYKKLLGIFEMSIKQRAKQLNVSIEKSNGKSKSLGQTR